MNSNTTTQGAAAGSAGAALAVSSVLIWALSLAKIEVPADVATAFVTLATIGTHCLVTWLSPKPTVNVPVESAPQSVPVPVETIPAPKGATP